MCFSFRVPRKTLVCQNGHRACCKCMDRLKNERRRCDPPVMCHVCGVVGEFQPAPHVDRELRQLPARCPYVRATTGVKCRWVGRFGDMRSHVHSMSDAPQSADPDRESAANSCDRRSDADK